MQDEAITKGDLETLKWSERIITIDRSPLRDTGHQPETPWEGSKELMAIW